MANFRCNMCGGTLEIDEKNSIATCEYCGTRQSLSKIDSDLYAKEQAKKDQVASEYESCLQEMKLASTASEYDALSKRLSQLEGYEDSQALSLECLDKAEIARKDWAYKSADAVLQNRRWSDLDECVRMHESAIRAFEAIRDWKDSSEKIEICKKRIENAKRQAEEKELAQKRKIQEFEAKRKKTANTIKKVVPPVAIVAVLLVLLLIVGTFCGVFFSVRAIIRALVRWNESLYYMEQVEESPYQAVSLPFDEKFTDFTASTIL